MSNSGKNTNNSKFFFTFKKTYWLDKLNIVFGAIVKNIEFLNKLELVECEKEIPKKSVKIVECGEINKKINDF